MNRRFLLGMAFSIGLAVLIGFGFQLCFPTFPWLRKQKWIEPPASQPKPIAEHRDLAGFRIEEVFVKENNEPVKVGDVPFRLVGGRAFGARVFLFGDIVQVDDETFLANFGVSRLQGLMRRDPVTAAEKEAEFKRLLSVLKSSPSDWKIEEATFHGKPGLIGRSKVSRPFDSFVVNNSERIIFLAVHGEVRYSAMIFSQNGAISDDVLAVISDSFEVY